MTRTVGAATAKVGEAGSMAAASAAGTRTPTGRAVAAMVAAAATAAAAAAVAAAAVEDAAAATGTAAVATIAAEGVFSQLGTRALSDDKANHGLHARASWGGRRGGASEAASATQQGVGGSWEACRVALQQFSDTGDDNPDPSVLRAAAEASWQYLQSAGGKFERMMDTVQSLPIPRVASDAIHKLFCVRLAEDGA